MTDMSPTQTIRRAMQARGLNQKETAAELEISEQYLSDILQKRRSISAFVAVRLESALGIDGRKLLIDQTLTEYERAKIDYAKAGETPRVPAQLRARRA